MGVIIETCVKYPGGRTRIRGTDMIAKKITVLVLVLYSIYYIG